MTRDRVLSLFRLPVCLLPCLLWLACGPAAAQTLEQDSGAAAILVYHRIGEDEYPEISIRKEQFESHIEELLSGDYRILPVADIIAAFKNGRNLPDKTVAITFDGGHRSVLENAVPVLEKNGIPYTVFISTDYADRGGGLYLSWSDIKSLSRSKLATIGLHPAGYTRLYDQPEKEIARQVNKARARFREETGREASLFAYPFGEFGQTYRNAIEKLGFAAAFGQQSGAAYAGEDIFALPRFPMTESYGDEARFRLTASALPLPVDDVEPKDPLLASAKPVIGFTIGKELQSRIGTLSCFVSDQEKPEMQIIGGRRIELRLSDALAPGRNRINCTLPLPLAEGESPAEQRWRWFGLQMIAPGNAENPPSSSDRL